MKRCAVLRSLCSKNCDDPSGSLLWTTHAENPAAVTISDATVAEPSVMFTAPGTYRFDLAVTDGASVSTTASTFVTVRSAPLPTSAAFAYDGDGDRIAMTVGGVTTRFVVDPLPQNARVLAERTGETWTYHVYGHDLLYSVTGTAFTVLHSDPLGSTIATTDATGAVTARMRYDVFGERLDTDTTTTPYTFAGERMDLTELQYLRARYYEPAVGRFISRDPFPAQAADTQTFNRYVYVKNNPTNYVDPSGEWLETAWDVISAGYSLYDVGKRLWNGEPVGEALLNLGFDGLSIVVPGLPAGITRAASKADDVVDAARGAGKAIENADDFKRTYNLKDGMEMSTDDALRKAEEVLGPGYTEIGTPGSGVFRSTGSSNQVRMTPGDLSPTNNHAGRPHINFDLLPTSGKGKMRCIIHLFLSDC